MVRSVKDSRAGSDQDAGRPGDKSAGRPRMTRAEQARATRRRIVAAATDLFLEHGYGATMLEQVAREASVSVQTVYFHFGNKPTLLKAALDIAAVGDDEPVALLQRPWLEEVRGEPDPTRMIALWVANGRSIMERVGPIMRVVHNASGTDPDLAAQWEVNEQQRLTAFATLAELLAERRALKPGMSTESARDIAFALGGVETYLLLTGTCHWSATRWERWTATTLAEALLSRLPDGQAGR